MLIHLATKVTTIDSETKLIREVQERMEKAKNIMIFGVNEDNDTDENSPNTVKRRICTHYLCLLL